MMKGCIALAAVLAASVALRAAGPQHAPPADQAIRAHRATVDSRSDDAIRYAIAIGIYNDPLFWNYAIQVEPPIHIIVNHGRVTLTGFVLSEVERRKAEVIARSVFGVFSVENNLRLEGDEI